jgi:hypothetical protein
MWESQPLATLRASTTCTGIALPFTLPYETSTLCEQDVESFGMLKQVVHMEPIGFKFLKNFIIFWWKLIKNGILIGQ